jgi:hypothetical protein
MKKLAITLSMIFFAMINTGISQFIADAGTDRVVCVGFLSMDTITIGGSPSATGGTPPYTYTWETEYVWEIGSHKFNYSASLFLNDTTLANPKLIKNWGDTLNFRLTVTDSKGISVIDTTTVYYSTFGTHLGYVNLEINLGDSVFLGGMDNVFGGFPPYQYLWRPNHGLTDSTSLAFWAKPEYPVSYYLTLTDSAGCVETGAPVYHVSVKHVNVAEYENQESMVVVYPNPMNDFLNIHIDPIIQGEFTLRLYLGNGKLIEEKRFSENTFKVDLQNYPNGIYIYVLNDTKGFSKQGRIIVK